MITVESRNEGVCGIKERSGNVSLQPGVKDSIADSAYLETLRALMPELTHSTRAREK